MTDVKSITDKEVNNGHGGCSCQEEFFSPKAIYSENGDKYRNHHHPTDYDDIESSILEDQRRFELREVGFDPFQATQLSSHLIEEGVPMVEVKPTVLNFSEPMKQLEALALSGKLRHNGCPILTWMVSNVVCHTDAKDNIYPRKERPENKIDGVVAALTALNRQMANQSDYVDVPFQTL